MREAPDTDVDTLCDGCGEPIIYKERVYVVPRGTKSEDGIDFVDYLCQSCKDATKKRRRTPCDDFECSHVSVAECRSVR